MSVRVGAARDRRAGAGAHRANKQASSKSCGHQRTSRFLRGPRARSRAGRPVTVWVFGGEFDPGSGSTLAACLMHASRAGCSSGRLRGGRVRNTWATCPGVGDSRGKPRVIPHTWGRRWGGLGKGLRARPGRGLRPISSMVGSRLTMAMIGSWSERTASHTGTETRPRLLREAAARNLPQWGQP